MSSFIIKDNNISFADISTIINKDFKLSIDNTIIEKIIASRKIFENTINNSDDKFYGINTGFGDLHNVKINNDELCVLQENLIKSHACGIGDKIDSKIVQHGAKMGFSTACSA